MTPQLSLGNEVSPLFRKHQEDVLFRVIGFVIN